MAGAPAFVRVSRQNVNEISKRLKRKGGYLLTVWRALNWEFTIGLYKKPRITFEPDTWVHSGHRGGNASNPLEDRQYRFGKKREKKGLDQLFTSLEVGEYDFAIGPKWGSSGINFTHGRYFYVPEHEHLAEALRHIFRNPIVPIEPPLASAEIDSMIAYALEDLKTKAVVREIVQAGMLADAACGLA